MFSIPEERQERYELLYNTVESAMKEQNLAETLFELCSVSLDRNGNESQVNLEFLLPSSLNAKKQLKKSFDKHSKQYGFTMNYVNLTGQL
jgi:hypothetical protein